MSDRRPLNPTTPHHLDEARLQAHHAAQVAAAPAATLLPRRDDHENRNLGWSPRHQALLGRPIGRLRAGLRIADLTWIVLQDGTIAQQQAAGGRSLEDGLAWLRQVWVQLGGEDSHFALPGYELPDHPTGKNQPFGGDALDRADLEALGRWFDAAFDRLQEATETFPGGPVRTWPHHFDMASLWVLEGEGESMRSVGMGFSPGDGAIAEPYHYVLPWPVPAADALPDLPVGRWHTEGFTAAVLTGSEGAHHEPDARAFLREAVPRARSLAQG
jgi:hypothetical protein